MWQPDGWDVRVRIGVIVPHADIGPESELRAIAPADVGIIADRLPFFSMTAGGTIDSPISIEAVRAFTQQPQLDDAVELLASAPIDVLAFAFTSSSYAMTADDEAAMIARLKQRTRGIPVVTTCSATVMALRRLGARSIALMDPPWFGTDLNQMGARYYAAHGFDVVEACLCDLPHDQHSVTPTQLYRWIRANTPKNANAIVIGGNGFRAVGIIDALERDLERPVLTANQVLLWAALRAACYHQPIDGYGQLLSILCKQLIT